MRVVIDTNIIVKAVKKHEPNHLRVILFLAPAGHKLVLDFEHKLLREYERKIAELEKKERMLKRKVGKKG